MNVSCLIPQSCSNLISSTHSAFIKTNNPNHFLLRMSLVASLTVSANFCAAQAISCVTPPTAEIVEESVRLMFGGDIVLGNSFAVEHIPKDWEERYFAGVRATLQQADMVVGNLEGTLTEHKTTRKSPGTGRQFAFRSPPHYADLLKQEGFTALNIANNHAYDFGEIGMRDTLNHLEKAEIAAVGLPGEIKILTLRNINIAIIGFSVSPWFNTVLDLDRGEELVRQAKFQASYVVATFHAGAEGSPAIWHNNDNELFMGENRGNTVAFSRAMIEAGADLVVGHGPHVLRAAECYKGKPIIYSLGNFVGVGGLSAQKLAAVSALLDVTINADGVLRSMNLLSLNFNEQKLPQLDPLAFGTRLVNYLGKHARYTGDFIEFPVSVEGQTEFDAWLKINKRHAELPGLN